MLTAAVVLVALMSTVVAALPQAVSANGQGAQCVATIEGGEAILTWSVPGGVVSSSAVRSGPDLDSLSWVETVSKPVSTWTGAHVEGDVYAVKTRVDGVRDEVPCAADDAGESPCAVSDDGAVVTVRWQLQEGSARVAIRSGTDADDTKWRATADRVDDEWTGASRPGELWVVRVRVDGVTVNHVCDGDPDPDPEPPVASCSVVVDGGVATVTPDLAGDRAIIRSGPSAADSRWRATTENGAVWAGAHSAGDAYFVRYRVAGQLVDQRCVNDPTPPPPEVDSICRAHPKGDAATFKWDAVEGAEAFNENENLPQILYILSTRFVGGELTHGVGAVRDGDPPESWQRRVIPGREYFVQVKLGGVVHEIPCKGLDVEPHESPVGFALENHMPESEDWASLPDGRIIYARSSALGEELWVTDGTREGTELVRDLFPGGDSQPGQFVAFRDQVFFVARTPGTGRELWRTDGTAEGTEVLDVVDGPNSLEPTLRLAAGDRLFFGAIASSSWVSDGTVEGTRKLPAPVDGWMADAFAVDGGYYLRTNVVVAGRTKSALWWVDDDLGSAQLLDPDVGRVAELFALVGDTLFVAGAEVVVYERAVGTPLTLPGAEYFTAAAAEDGAYLLGGQEGDPWGIWFSDGTEVGTELLASEVVAGDAGPAFVSLVGTVNGNLVYERFFGDDRTQDYWLLARDGAAPAQIFGAVPVGITRVTQGDGVLYFSPELVGEYVRTDGTLEGTIREEGDRSLRHRYVWNGELHFSSYGDFGVYVRRD